MIPLRFADTAQASTLTAQAGLTIGTGSGIGDARSISLLLGGEYTLSVLPQLEIGGFFDYNRLTSPSRADGGLSFIGGVARFTPMTELPFFSDARAGISWQSFGEESTSPNPAFGVGVGYVFRLRESISLSPRIGARILEKPPASGGSGVLRTLGDLSVLLSFRF